MVNLARKPRRLSRLEKLSVDALRRMGLPSGVDTKQSLALITMLESFEKMMREKERRLLKEMEKKLAELKEEIERSKTGLPHGIMVVSVSPGGVRSTPPVGSHKIKNIYMLPDGQFHLEFEDIPV